MDTEYFFSVLILAAAVVNFIYLWNLSQLMRHMKDHHDDLAEKYCVNAFMGFAEWLGVGRHGFTLEDIGKMFALFGYLIRKRYVSARDPRLLALCDRTRVSFLVGAAATAALFVGGSVQFLS